MDEQECLIVYQELEAMLAELNLAWVGQQVAEVVRSGKTVEERSPTRRTPITKVEDYTAQEQLLLLISAVEQAVIHSWEMERELAHFFSRESQASSAVAVLSFASASRDSGKKIDLNFEALEQRAEQAMKLQELLAKLRGEVDNSGD